MAAYAGADLPPKNIKIGIIGGTGIGSPDILKSPQHRRVTTAYGDPSGPLVEGEIDGIQVAILSRHGQTHTIMPTNVNYRANVLALKEAGCTHLLVSAACGSLREDYAPGDLVILDQFIDRTTKRAVTFYDGLEGHLKGIAHFPSHEPFCPKMREILIATAKSLDLKCHPEGTIVVIEGPRFSSKAESRMFQKWGGDVIGMTTFPEVILAMELGIPYASIGIVTDYDAWKNVEDHSPVHVEMVTKTLEQAGSKAINLMRKVISEIAQFDWTEIHQENKNRIKTSVFGGFAAME
ncbi:unnamed protein product [Cyprideis torosa]|uniref:S-methyl-5'-thioadenosine phosphorylase n=1 Tax=Cyprideis torosa TaxID=163714 RepID=A0A7R8W1R9_9CRUS|nr:unnamed protein product [Cyprideis torosa]CAG0880109.1 unnamed protein product [Cyprideis torosa]